MSGLGEDTRNAMAARAGGLLRTVSIPGSHIDHIRTASLNRGSLFPGKGILGPRQRRKNGGAKPMLFPQRTKLAHQRTPPLAGTSTQAPNKQTDFERLLKTQTFAKTDVMAADEN